MARHVDADNLAELDRRSSLHPFTSIAEQQAVGPHIIVSGSGIRIKDAEGREYIDAMAGLWCVNVGYGRQELIEAMRQQAERLPYYHSFMGLANEPAIRLADRLAERTPGTLRKVFFGNSGSDANDTQVKLVWYYNNLLGRPQKKKILARWGGYHGVTVASASLTGLPPLHKAFDLPIDRFGHVGRPHYYWDARPGESESEFSKRLAEELDQRIQQEGPDTVAAFIAEPLQAAGSVIAPPQGYFESIVPVLKKHDVLLIADEVVCGFGRLGRWFGSEYYGLQPDLMTVAKGLTSAYLPMSAVIVSDPNLGGAQVRLGRTRSLRARVHLHRASRCGGRGPGEFGRDRTRGTGRKRRQGRRHICNGASRKPSQTIR
jgi:L-2,4-diaminobutyrate transaminase